MPTIEEYQKRIVEDLAALGIKAPTEEDLIVPMLEGLDFGADSFIAHFTVDRHYRVSTEVDYVEHNQDDPEYVVPQPDLPRIQLGDYYQMFYRSKEVAGQVNDALTDGEYKPRLYWTFSAPSATMKSSPDLEKFVSSFGDTLLFWVRVVGLDKGSKSYPRKDRHEYNFVALPAAVQAMADVQGIEVPAYDLSLLSAPDASDAFGEEFFVQHFGHADGAYEGCTFDKYREALWAALGEPDSRKTSVKGSKTIDRKGNVRPDPLATESEVLSKCLIIAQSEVTVWARVIRVPNPACEVFEKQAPKIVALTEIFVNEEHATLVGQAELAEKGQQADTSGVGQPTGLPFSGGWVNGKAFEVVNFLTENKVIPLDNEVTRTVPEPMRAAQDEARAALVEASFLDTWEDLVAWAEYAKANG